jgi:cytoskeletal protein CcmA (bactofilin family)
MAEHTDDLAIAKNLVRPAPTGPEASPNKMLAPTPAFLGGTMQSGSPQFATGSTTDPRISTNSAVEPRKLIVGPGITLSGEINSCDHLVVEGNVHANLHRCKHVMIAQTGLFGGNAIIDEAEVHGRFEGDLTVRNRLSIRATGHVSGSVSYRQIEIEAGGQISGTIATP